MRYQLDLTLRHAEGALIRVFGLIERRGFHAVALTGAADTGAGVWTMQLTVESERSDHTLLQQLGKLHDCLSVDISPLA